MVSICEKRVRDNYREFNLRVPGAPAPTTTSGLDQYATGHALVVIASHEQFAEVTEIEGLAILFDEGVTDHAALGASEVREIERRLDWTGYTTMGARELQPLERMREPSLDFRVGAFMRSDSRVFHANMVRVYRSRSFDDSWRSCRKCAKTHIFTTACLPRADYPCLSPRPSSNTAQSVSGADHPVIGYLTVSAILSRGV